MKTSSPDQSHCSCELRDRLWNMQTKRCQRCGLPYRVAEERADFARALSAAADQLFITTEEERAALQAYDVEKNSPLVDA